MAEVFQCSWETGTGVQNTSPTAPEDAWDLDSTGAGETKRTDTMSAGFGSNYLRSTTVTANYLEEDAASASGTWYFRFAFRINTLPNAGEKKYIMTARNSTSSDMKMAIRFHNDAGTPKLLGVVNAAETEFGSITIATGTVYQIIAYFTKNTATGAWYEVYDSTGSTLQGSRQTTGATTDNEDVDRLRLQDPGDLTAGSWSADYDIVYVDDADNPGPVLAGGSGLGAWANTIYDLEN